MGALYKSSSAVKKSRYRRVLICAFLRAMGFLEKVSDKQWPGTDCNQSPALKTKWEITKITISQNTKITYGKPNGQLSPKRWPLSNVNLT